MRAEAPEEHLVNGCLSLADWMTMAAELADRTADTREREQTKRKPVKNP